MSIRVGTRLYGYCGGFFGGDDYRDKRVEALGEDWIVVRYEWTDEVGFCSFVGLGISGRCAQAESGEPVRHGF